MGLVDFGGFDVSGPARKSVPALALSVYFVAVACFTATHACADQQVVRDLAQNTVDALRPQYTPRALGKNDVKLYRQIFAAQEKGDWRKADKLIGQLDDDLLIGHVKFQRYMHPTAYTSKFSELKGWMASYWDHPDALRIYRLSLRKKPSGATNPKRPEKKRYRPDPDYVEIPAFSGNKRSRAQSKRVAEINRYAKSLLARERPTQTLNHIKQPNVRKDLTQAEYDRILSWIANQYFLERVPGKALRVAQEVTTRSREVVPLADWTAGLSAWQMGKRELAANHFEALAKAKYATPSTKAAGAYWAARAFLVTRQPRKVSPMLEIAAREPFSFYGVLANRQLANEEPYRWKAPSISKAGAERLMMEYPAVARAVAFAQLGRNGDSEKELKRVHGKVDPSYDLDLLAIASRLDLPSSQLQIAEYASVKGLETGLYPIPSYEPKSGFEVDRALLYAFMRKESKFDTQAKSWAGARGLMQLMPRTASYVAKDASLRNGRKDRLFDPGFNLDLGQKYLKQLMSSGNPRGNLFMLTASYNGGPGNVRKWTNELDDNTDPLFFIESLPSRETRNFIESVLTNLWIYRHRLGQDAPSLDAAAEGRWPIYETVERRDDLIAMR